MRYKIRKKFSTDRRQPCAGTILPHLSRPKPSPDTNEHYLHSQTVAYSGYSLLSWILQTEGFTYVLLPQCHLIFIM